jgi:hypothetical protein
VQHCDDTILATPIYSKLNSRIKFPKKQRARETKSEREKTILKQNENSIQRRMETQLYNIIAITLFKNFNHRDCDDAKYKTDELPGEPISQNGVKESRINFKTKDESTHDYEQQMNFKGETHCIALRTYLKSGMLVCKPLTCLFSSKAISVTNRQRNRTQIFNPLAYQIKSHL